VCVAGSFEAGSLVNNCFFQQAGFPASFFSRTSPTDLFKIRILFFFDFFLHMLISKISIFSSRSPRFQFFFPPPEFSKTAMFTSNRFFLPSSPFVHQPLQFQFFFSTAVFIFFRLRGNRLVFSKAIAYNLSKIARREREIFRIFGLK